MYVLGKGAWERCRCCAGCFRHVCARHRSGNDSKWFSGCFPVRRHSSVNAKRPDVGHPGQGWASSREPLGPRHKGKRFGVGCSELWVGREVTVGRGLCQVEELLRLMAPRLRQLARPTFPVLLEGDVRGQRGKPCLRHKPVASPPAACPRKAS